MLDVLGFFTTVACTAAVDLSVEAVYITQSDTESGVVYIARSYNLRL